MKFWPRIVNNTCTRCSMHAKSCVKRSAQYVLPQTRFNTAKLITYRTLSCAYIALNSARTETSYRLCWIICALSWIRKRWAEGNRVPFPKRGFNGTDSGVTPDTARNKVQFWNQKRSLSAMTKRRSAVRYSTYN